MIYEVDVNRIKKQLEVLQLCGLVISDLEGQPVNHINRFALERALHVAVECMIDVGTVMIDGFIMRDPGGYHDIVDILEDERVITSKLGEWMKEQVTIREQLVRYYHELDEEKVEKMVSDHKLYAQFCSEVLHYIEQELNEMM
ncbi:DUF86 domain-containing protein [Hazenella sp. IB182357]|uniref:DUF86 domain-containing protein n=1 Tax=Polycladospora coralii TaxID=2771432 RepID=A0A926RSB3_9BACL|nr:DUF86 domain-containing protein [Polycladospora coralii]MBS7529814.1 DUF86 domain-containing protein [Polycladospora coralii]